MLGTHGVNLFFSASDLSGLSGFTVSGVEGATSSVSGCFWVDNGAEYWFSSGERVSIPQFSDTFAIYIMMGIDEGGAMLTFY